MSAALSFVSFLSFTLLSIIFPTQCNRSCGPTMYIVIWLLFISLSNGLTASMPYQSSSNSLHWCDVATHVSYVSSFAIAMSSFSVVVHCAWSRSSHERKRHHDLVYFVSCIGLPFLYMLSYTNVRSEQFLVVQSYGCISSTSPSHLTLVVLDILPLTVCIATMALTAFVILIQRRNGIAARRAGSVEVPPSNVIWRYLLLASLSVVLVIISSSLSAAFMISSEFANQLNPGGRDVPLYLTDMPILQSLTIVLSWWTAPVASTLVCLILMSNSESWRAYQDLLDRMKRLFSVNRNVTSLPMVSTDTSFAPVYHLRSGWDDTFRGVPAAPLKSVSTLHVDTSDATLRSLPQTNAEEEIALDSFAESTLTYVGSPTGQRALASSPCAFSPPHVATPPTLMVAPPTPTFGPSPVHPISRKESDGQLSAFSTLSDSRSLLASSAWPTPPAVLPAPPFASYRPDVAREVVPRRSIRHTRQPTGLGVRMNVEQRIT